MEKQDNLSKNEEPEFRDFSPTRIALKNKIITFSINRGLPYTFALITPAPHIAPGMRSERLSIV